MPGKKSQGDAGAVALIVLGDGAAFVQQCRGLDLFVLLALQGAELENESGEVRLREAIARLAEPAMEQEHTAKLDWPWRRTVELEVLNLPWPFVQTAGN